MKGRKPKPTAFRLIEGNREHRTIHAELEPKPQKTAPNCPKELKADEREAWRYLVQELSKMGTLASSDRGNMAAYCYSWALWRKAKRKLNELSSSGNDPEVIETAQGNYIQNPWLNIANRAMADIVKYGASLGLDPTSRTRIKLDKPIGEGRRERLLS